MLFTIEPFQAVSVVILLEGPLVLTWYFCLLSPGGEVFGIHDTTCTIS